MPLDKILLLGDSFGTQRRHGDQTEVPAEKTWPSQVQHRFPTKQIDSDFLGFRRLVECPTILSEYSDCDLIVLQAGIVDIYPRPFPHGFSKSMRLPCRITRRVVRPWRREWINYVHRTTWSSKQEILDTFELIDAAQPKTDIGFVTVAPLTDKDATQTPGAQEAIMRFNDLLREQIAKRKNWFAFDLHAEAMVCGSLALISPFDSHLNQAGNDWLAQRVASKIGEIANSQNSKAA